MYRCGNNRIRKKEIISSHTNTHMHTYIHNTYSYTHTHAHALLKILFFLPLPYIVFFLHLDYIFNPIQYRVLFTCLRNFNTSAFR